jgi:hypothetical protein
MIYALEDKNRCATCPSRGGPSGGKYSLRTLGHDPTEDALVQEANINAVFTDDFYSSISLQRTPLTIQKCRKNVPPFVRGRTVILSYEQDDDFEDS